MRSHRLIALLLAGLLTVGVAGPAAAKIKIHKIRYDPPGADYASDSQLRAEYIVIRNTGNRRRQLQNWVVKDQDGHGFKFPGELS